MTTATTQEKVDRLIVKFQNSDFAPVVYSVPIWGEGKWVRKTKYYLKESYAVHDGNYDGTLTVSITPNPEYPGYGINKFKAVFLVWEHDRVEFRSYGEAKKFVLDNLKKLWDGYNKDIVPEPEF